MKRANKGTPICLPALTAWLHTFGLNGEVECKDCHGTGWVECEECDGTGNTECSRCGHYGECHECEGEGRIPCEDCNPDEHVDMEPQDIPTVLGVRLDRGTAAALIARIPGIVAHAENMDGTLVIRAKGKSYEIRASKPRFKVRDVPYCIEQIPLPLKGRAA